MATEEGLDVSFNHIFSSQICPDDLRTTTSLLHSLYKVASYDMWVTACVCRFQSDDFAGKPIYASIYANAIGL